MVADTRLTFDQFRAALYAAVAPEPETPAQLWEAGQALGDLAERLGLTLEQVVAAIQQPEAA